MHQLTQLGGDAHRQRLADADQQRAAERLLALDRVTRRAERAGRRMRRADRQARRLRAQLEAWARLPALITRRRQAPPVPATTTRRSP